MPKGWKVGRFAQRACATIMLAVVLTSCGWKGIANVPLPGGPGTGADKLTIYVQMPDTLALNVNSRVRVADVFVGSVRSIELKDWVATLTLDLQPGLKLPVNTQAKIGQTTLLGSQHVQLDVATESLDPVAQERRHDLAAEFVGLPDNGAGAGQHRHDPHRWGHPEPRDHPDRDQQRSDRPGRPDPRIPRQAGHVHRRTEPAAPGHHPRHRFDQPVAVHRRAAQRHPGSGADGVPATDQTFRRHPGSVRRRRDARSGRISRPRTKRCHRRTPTCTRTC